MYVNRFHNVVAITNYLQSNYNSIPKLITNLLEDVKAFYINVYIDIYIILIYIIEQYKLYLLYEIIYRQFKLVNITAYI